MQPYVAVNYIIALTGVFPSRTRRLEEEGLYGRTDQHSYNVTERQLQGGSDPFVGQITMFAGTFAPSGWALCDGALLPIPSNDALFSLIGIIYGGDGFTTFALPDLRGRVPIHYGSGPGLTPRNIGAKGGVETVAYSENEIPLHTHDSLDVAGLTPLDAVLSSPTSSPRQVTVSEFDPLDGVVIGSAGRNPPFDKNNMQPFQAINFAIALQGVFPSRSRMLHGEDSEGEPERLADQAHRRLFEPCLAFVSLFAFHFPPRGFAACNGQILPINQNQALFSLLGTTYGGDGRTSFGLPDLQGRTPMHAGVTSNLWGQKTGVETTTLTMDKMPSHSHSFSVDLVEPLIGNVTVAEDPFTDLCTKKSRLMWYLLAHRLERQVPAAEELIRTFSRLWGSITSLRSKGSTRAEVEDSKNCTSPTTLMTRGCILVPIDDLLILHPLLERLHCLRAILLPRTGLSAMASFFQSLHIQNCSRS